jgi:hypothetical protein
MNEHCLDRKGEDLRINIITYSVLQEHYTVHKLFTKVQSLIHFKNFRIYYNSLGNIKI